MEYNVIGTESPQVMNCTEPQPIPWAWFYTENVQQPLKLRPCRTRQKSTGQYMLLTFN